MGGGLGALEMNMMCGMISGRTEDDRGRRVANGPDRRAPGGLRGWEREDRWWGGE